MQQVEEGYCYVDIIPVGRVEHVLNLALVDKLREVDHDLLELLHAQELFVHVVDWRSDSVGVGLGANQGPET